jgi:hypothetical protein
MFVFACPIIAKSQCWLFALRTNTGRICPQISVFALIFIWPSSFRGEDFQKSTNRNKNCLWWPCFLTNRAEIIKYINLYTGLSIDPLYQVTVHLAKRIQRRRFVKDCSFRPDAFTNMAATDTFVILVSDWSISKKSSPLKPLGQMYRNLDRDEMNNLYRGPYIHVDAFYQVSVHLAKGLTDDGRQVMAIAHVAFGKMS